MLTIARTLMGNPDLLLLDEPSEGLAPLVVDHLGEQIGRLKREGLTILYEASPQTPRLASRASLGARSRRRTIRPSSGSQDRRRG
jgi:ABC-type branched-subunit amino acid transport system ATPase component